MKITLVTTHLGGGAGIACLRLHSSLLAAGVDSNVLTLYSDRNDPRIQGLIKSKTALFVFKVLRKLPFLVFIRFYGELLKIKLKFNARYEIASPPFSIFNLADHPLIKDSDIVNFHWVGDLVDYQSFFDRFNKPVVWTLHDLNPIIGMFHYNNDTIQNRDLADLNDSYVKLKHQALIRNKKKIHFVTLSQWMNSQIEYHLPELASQATLIRNSINPSAFRPREDFDIHKHFGLKKDKKHIIFVSENLSVPRKGFDLLLETLPLLNDPELELIAVGQVPPKDQKQDERIVYVGKIQDPRLMAGLFSISSLFVIPSREDNLPNVIVEANLVGCPVVGFDIGGISEMVQDGFNGFKSKELSPVSLSETIHKALKFAFDKEAIISFTKETYSPEVQASKFLKLFDELNSKK